MLTNWYILCLVFFQGHLIPERVMFFGNIMLPPTKIY